MFGINMLLRARLSQWFGMILVSGIGYVVYELLEGGFGSETAAVLSSFAIGLAGFSQSLISFYDSVIEYSIGLIW